MLTDNIKWLGHAAFRVDGSKTIYFDPFRIEEGKKADIILVSHKHHDHCSKEDILKILKPDTLIVTEADSAEILQLDNMIIVKPYDSISVEGIEIQALPAYNVTKPHHPRENGWLGFLVNIDGKTIYHAGDTDCIEEMRDITTDVALIPIYPDNKYVMTPEEAAQATYYINTKVAVPMHFGVLGGSKGDALTVAKKGNPEIQVVILESQKNSF